MIVAIERSRIERVGGKLNLSKHITFLFCSNAVITEYKLSIPSYVSFSTSIKMIMTIFYSGEMGYLVLSRAPAAVSRELAKVLIELMVLVVLNHVKVN